ncbi:MAG: hypothetical protein QXO75_00675 [Nitrososphaerota archaeon]
MTVAEQIHVEHVIEADAGESGYVHVYTVPAGKTFILKRVRIHFDADCKYNLSLAIFFGNVQILPIEGTFKGSDETIEASTYWTFLSGEPVKLYYSNAGTTVTHATVVIEGELE